MTTIRFTEGLLSIGFRTFYWSCYHFLWCSRRTWVRSFQNILRILTHILKLAVILVFRFLLGTAGASFLSVAGGSIADMFAGPKVAT
jgi:hypothetical protein